MPTEIQLNQGRFLRKRSFEQYTQICINNFLDVFQTPFLLFIFNFLNFKRFYLFIFRETIREREKHQCVVASCVPPTGDLVSNPGSCPDWESNW